MRPYAILGVLVLCCACQGRVDVNGSDSSGHEDNNGGLDNGSPNNGSGNNGTVAPDPFPDLPCEGVACEDPVPSASARVVRLTHHQWENAVRDLLRLDGRPGLSSTFLNDTLSTSIFNRQAEDLTVQPGLWEDYREAAETLAAQVASDEDALAALMPPGAPTDGEARARAFVEAFGQRAYRRPLTDEEVDSMLALMAESPELFSSGTEFARAAELALRAFLQSPHFLYRVETHDVEGAEVVSLSGWERASRLSFALWNTIPDDELLAAAAAGELDSYQQVQEQARRMLDDPRARDAIEDFHAQLLGFHHFVEMQKNEERFPTYSESMRHAMEEELKLFIQDVVMDTDGSFEDLMTASHTFVNQEIESIYGVDVADSDEFVRVDLDPAQRPGLLTRSGWLALNATAYDPNPIHRGVFVDERMLCMNLPPPPDDFTIPDGVEGDTNRERISNATDECGGACHRPLINPPGFAFENYDALGAWRTTDGGVTVDASGTLVFDGVQREWDDGAGLIGFLAESQQAHQCYVSHWFEYLNGRPPAAGDAPLIARLGQASVESEASIKELIVAIVSSDVFLKRARSEE